MSARFPHRFEKDPNLIEDFPIKSYGCHEIIIEVAHKHGLKTVLVNPNTNEGFLVIHVIATHAQKKAAQLEWLTRMAVGGVEADRERQKRLEEHFAQFKTKPEDLFT